MENSTRTIDKNTTAPFANTLDFIKRFTNAPPDQDALLFLPSGSLDADPVRTVRHKVISNIISTAMAFRRLGVGPDDVVSILSPNLIETQYAFWGAEAAGIVNPINFLLSPEHIAGIMRSAGSKVLVALGPQAPIGIWEKALAVKELVPNLETLIVIGPPLDGVRSLNELIAAETTAEETFDCAKSPEDVAAYFHTGGTTGAPKLIVHSHANQIAAAIAMIDTFSLDPKGVLWSGLPMFHVAGSILLSLAPLAAGTKILMPTPAGNRDPQILKNYWKLVEKYRVTLGGGVPTSLSDILVHGSSPNLPHDLDHICMAGGAQLLIGLEKKFVAQTRIPIHQIYGMTETAGIIAAAPRSEAPRIGAIGKVVGNVQCGVFKPDPTNKRGAPCAAGEPGVLHVKGPNIAASYKSAKTLSPLPDADGWLNTGDLGFIDEDGWVHITGRAKDVIIRSGHNIDPAAIEEIAESHPGVVQAVAVGRPDLRAGEVPVVFVTLTEDAAVTAEGLKSFIAENISEAPAKPANVQIISEIPLTAVGKIFKPALRSEAIRAFIADTIENDMNGINAPTVEIDKTSQQVDRLIIRCENEAIKTNVIERFDDWLSQFAFEYSIV